MEKRSIRVETSLYTKEMTIQIETDIGMTDISVNIVRSRLDDRYFVMLRDESGNFLEMMKEADVKPYDNYKVFESTVEHFCGTFTVSVAIDIDYRKWSIEVE
jgi:hypothetical protein